MGSNYDDRQTELEQGFRSDYSSAGLDTQRLAAPQTPGVSGMLPGALASPQRRTHHAAIVLISVGICILLSRLGMGQIDLAAGLVLLTIGSCFLFFAFWRRIYGLSIPGLILSGLSVGVTFAELTGGVSVLWGLSLGFLLIYILGNALFRVHSPWPVIPSVILFGVGCIAAITQLPSIFAGGLIWLPLLLVGAGLYLGWGCPTACLATSE